MTNYNIIVFAHVLIFNPVLFSLSKKSMEINQEWNIFSYFIPANNSCCGPMWNTPLLSPDVLAIFTVCVKLSMFLRCRARCAFPERRISLKLWVWLFGGSYSQVWKLCSPRWMSPRMPYSIFLTRGVHKLWLSTTSLSIGIIKFLHDIIQV